MPNSQPFPFGDYIRSIPDFPKPGVLFRDITPLLSHPEAFRRAVAEMAEPFRDKGIGAVAAAEARGFIFAAPVALELDAALVPLRKPGKLPFKTLSYSYDLEYGADALQIHADALSPGTKVLIIDDLLATGGTIEACCHLVEKAGGTVVGCAFLVELTPLRGRERIARYPAISLVQYAEA